MGFKDLVAGAMNWHKTINDNNAEAETRIGSLERNLSNPNILINSNFKASELVNQRGRSSYPNISGYCIDMWRVQSKGDTLVQLDVEADCIKISSLGVTSDTFSDFIQSVENYMFYKNKEITVTIDYELSLGASVSFFADGLEHNKRDGDNLRKKESFTFTYNGNVWNNIFSIRLYRNINNNVGDYIKVYSIKAELGGIATPFIDDDPATKLAKCQRYYQQKSLITEGFVIGTNIFRVSFQLPTTMRARPTLLSSKDDITFFIFTTGNNIFNKITGITQHIYSVDSISLDIATSQNMTIGDSGQIVIELKESAEL